MKSKIVKQFGAMLLAGTMIVTSGNVTTYAAEQTDESQEVDVNTESETEQDELYTESKSDEDAEVMQDEQEKLYGSNRKEIEKIAEGDGYVICKENIDGKEKNVAHLWVDKRETQREPDDILNSILKYDCMKKDSVVALTTAYKEISVPQSVVTTLKNKKMEFGVVTGYYSRKNYYELYFGQIDDVDINCSFKIQYNEHNDMISSLSEIGVDGYIFSITDIDEKKGGYDHLYSKGILKQEAEINGDLYNKSMNSEKLKLYYYDSKRKRYILINSKIDYKSGSLIGYEIVNGVRYDVDNTSIRATITGINYYGTYLVCNSILPDSMVFNLTGLEKDGDSLLYYTNGLRDTSYTGLCDYDGTTYYVKDGSVDYNANMLYEYNGSTWNIKNGKVDTTESMTMNNGSLVYTNGGKTNNETTLCKYNGEWYYIHNGKVDYSATTLYKYNGSWWYIENGKVNFNKNGLCKYNGSWWYISGGKVNFNATGLCKYNGSWWYVSGGKVNFNATGLCKYNGSWWYVSSGRVNFNATGLCKYNGSWWYVSGGRVNFNATGLCKYNGTWWYVSSGRVNFNATGLCKYNGYWFYVENGAVRFKNTLCKYNGTWWYINNGVVNFSKTTLCKYGKNWFAVNKGKVAWNYTGYINYNGGRYKVINGVVKF